MVEAAAAVAGEFQRAADHYDQIQAQPDAAFARLQAAKHLVAAGRRAEANAQLRRAVAFYHRVSATGYLRESQTLLAATAEDCSHSWTFVSPKAGGKPVLQAGSPTALPVVVDLTLR